MVELFSLLMKTKIFKTLHLSVNITKTDHGTLKLGISPTYHRTIFKASASTKHTLLPPNPAVTYQSPTSLLQISLIASEGLLHFSQLNLTLSPKSLKSFNNSQKNSKSDFSYYNHEI